MDLRELVAAMFLFALIVMPLESLQAQSVRPPANAVNQGIDKQIDEQIGTSNTLGTNSQSDYWRDLRHGKDGLATSGQSGRKLIQAQGEQWRIVRKTYIVKYGGWVLATAIFLIVLFYLIRGKIRLKAGRSGETISRFSLPHRTAHWFMASIFILLSISGLILLLGRTVLMPVIGKNAHSIVASAAMQGHNLFGPLFIVALIWLTFMFIRGNFFQMADLKWILKGGGLLGPHASAGHYNFGEKGWFWLVVIAGSIMAITGMILEFPWLAESLQLLQISVIVHAIGAIALISAALGHIYIGTLGMEGALDSMTTGDVDVVWAKEHHDLWYEEVTGQKVANPEAEGSQSIPDHNQISAQSQTTET
ncbi:MAG: formate dehydrogenase subunit gamma [Hyphomicrobiales bacterium]|nr:formate dehydrogenase subunit gamma [Hyphomicrobiales bacterium]